MVAVEAAVSTVEAAEAVFTAEVAEAGVTLISVVAGVPPVVQAERHRARFQGQVLVGIAPTVRGRTV